MRKTIFTIVLIGVATISTLASAQIYFGQPPERGERQGWHQRHERLIYRHHDYDRWQWHHHRHHDWDDEDNE